MGDDLAAQYQALVTELGGSSHDPWSNDEEFEEFLATLRESRRGGGTTMRLQPEAITKLEPRLIQRGRGGWLAATPPRSSVRLCVEGATEAEAREEFHRMLEVFRKAFERYLALYSDPAGFGRP